MEKRAISSEDVKRLFGDISDHKTGEIISSGISIVELEKIASLLAGDTGPIRETGRLTPKAQDIYNLISRDEEAWGEDRD